MFTHMLQTPKVVWQAPAQDQLEKICSCFCGENRISLVRASQTPVHTFRLVFIFFQFIDNLSKKTLKSISTNEHLQYKHDYDSQTNSEFAHNCRECRTKSLLTWQQRFRIKSNYDHYRVPPTSCLASRCKTSISIIAASRYLGMDRTTLMATSSFFSLSIHSKTCPNVPERMQ